MKRFVDSQAQFVGDTLLEAQPMQSIAKERRDVSSASAAEDEPRGSVENALQSINLLFRNPRKQTVLIIAAGEYEGGSESQCPEVLVNSASVTGRPCVPDAHF